MKFYKDDREANPMTDEKFSMLCMLPLFILLVVVEHPDIGLFKTILWVVFLEAVCYCGFKWGFKEISLKRRK